LYVSFSQSDNCRLKPKYLFEKEVVYADGTCQKKCPSHRKSNWLEGETRIDTDNPGGERGDPLFSVWEGIL